MKSPFIKTSVYGLLLILSLSLGVPKISMAADTGSYVPLAPIAQLTEGKGFCDTKKSVEDQKIDPNCRTNVKNFIENAIKFTIAVAGALAVVMITVGGFHYVTSAAIGGKSEGRGMIENAIYGLLLALGAYIILNTVSPATLRLDFNLQGIKPSSMTPPSSASTTPPGNNPCPGNQTRQPDGSCTINSTPGNRWPQDWPGGAPSPSDAAIRIVLQKLEIYPVPISVKGSQTNANCTNIGQPGCTSLDGISSRALNGLSYLSALCNAEPGCGLRQIVITGGTEYWNHGNGNTNPSLNNTQHRPGGGAIDLSYTNTVLNDLIKKGGLKAGMTGCAPGDHYVVNGVTYVFETPDKNHWHVCY